MNSRERPAVDPVEQAIGRVLDSERGAQQSIAAANAAARAESRRIDETVAAVAAALTSGVTQ
jgi:hypothetical protein